MAAAYLTKELLREVYATTDVAEAHHRPDAFHQHCRHADVRELTRLSRTVRRWQSQVLAWHATALTNGPTEAVNLLVMKVKRVGHGFRNGWYTNFARFYSSRSEPAVQRLLSDDEMRTELFPRPDADLATALREIDRMAANEGVRFSGWHGFSTEQVRAFLEAHPPPSP